MTSNYHTPVTTGAAANASTINNPLGQLDSAITTVNSTLSAKTRTWAGKTAAPTVNDDSGDGIAVGDRWIDETNDREYVCLNATLGAAIWKETTLSLNAPTGIDGIQLIWNSATSVTVGVGTCYAPNGDLIDITSALVKSGLSLSASTWYHLYVYLSGGTPAAEVVTTAPAAWKGSAYGKTADTSRRYVGSVRTDGSGNIYEFLHDPRTSIMQYLVANGASPFRVLSSGSATVNTNVSCSAVIPVTARIGRIRFTNSPSSTQIASIGLGSVVIFTLSVVANGFSHIFADWVLDTSQQFSYSYPSAGGVLHVDVLGYLFNR